jgi:hypothetical protein
MMKNDNALNCPPIQDSKDAQFLKLVRDLNISWYEYMCAMAAKNNHLDTLKWLDNNNICPHSWTFANAAYKGHMNVLMWLKDNAIMDETSSYAAARGGDLDILKWTLKNANPMQLFDYFEQASLAAAHYGHLQILQFLYACIENGADNNTTDIESGDYKFSENVCASAATGGQFEILRWLKQHNTPWDESVCENAAQNGHLEMLQWARANGCPWNIDVCRNAALGGHFKLLKWAIENGCDWNNIYTFENAAFNGHFDMMKYLKTNGCSWGEYTFDSAAENDNIEILDWLKDNGCPLSSLTLTRILRIAAEAGHINVLEWTKTNTEVFCNMKEGTDYTPHGILICARAARSGNTEVLKWLRKNEFEWDGSTIKEALDNGHMKTAKWARENGCPEFLSENVVGVNFVK